MKIIKIDKSTIRKNPNAGNTVTYFNGKISAEFKIEGNIPEFIFHPPFYILEGLKENDKFISVFGYIDGPIEQKFVDEAPNLQITIHQEPIKIEHLPEPEYFYDYEKTFLRCKECGKQIEVNEITEDWEEDFKILICPNCDGFNTFPEFRYQTLKEVQNESKQPNN